MSAFSDGIAAKANGDFESAAEIWFPLAASGDPQARYMLCLVYQDHLDRKMDAALIAREMEVSAEEGNPRAQYYLSIMYRFGKGVRQDDETSLSWLKRAANQGEEGAKYRLSAMYQDGIGVAQDTDMADQWRQGLGDQPWRDPTDLVTDAAE